MVFKRNDPTTLEPICQNSVWRKKKACCHVITISTLSWLQRIQIVPVTEPDANKIRTKEKGLIKRMSFVRAEIWFACNLFLVLYLLECRDKKKYKIQLKVRSNAWFQRTEQHSQLHLSLAFSWNNPPSNSFSFLIVTSLLSSAVPFSFDAPSNN